MIDNVWIAFLSGMIVGSSVGIMAFAISLINKDNRLRNTIDENEIRINDLELQRELLKGEIFRMSKNYKPRKPQPRNRRQKFQKKYSTSSKKNQSKKS